MSADAGSAAAPPPPPKRRAPPPRREGEVLAHLSPLEYAHARCVIVSSIIATDMKKHDEKCIGLGLAKDDAFLALTPPNPKAGEPLDATVQLFVEVALHAADLGAQTLPIASALAWGRWVNDEFARQAREERARGLAVTPYMEGLENNQLKVMKSQLGFCSYVLEPLFAPLALSLIHI